MPSWYESHMQIPVERLAPELLTAVIESFVLREGTDYGEREASLETKIEQVRRQLASGEAVLLFDSESESVTIVCRRDVPREP